MDEYFLQFLWKFQKFRTNRLILTSGEPLTVYHPGQQNQDSGPDFFEAKIKIDQLVWSGSVEIHYKSSEWLAHKHHQDKAYENVILHVVWKQDKDIHLDSKPIPTLELSTYVLENLESEYRKYINQPEVILCRDRLLALPKIQINAMLDRAFTTRLQEKGKRVTEILATYEDDWEETAYYMLARNFGFKTNSANFERLARSLPYRIIKKHTDRGNQVEALIFGMAGFLEEELNDNYHRSLNSEFQFLKKKYDLQPSLSRHHWKFARLRPANFPTVRLAQFITLLIHTGRLFPSLLRMESTKEAIVLLKHPLTAYWQKHYDFQKESKNATALGRSSIENVIINSIAPILTAYAKYVDDVTYLEKAQSILSGLKPENNYITKAWISANVSAANACDSQALIHQYQSFCKQKKCLQCNIGITILNQ